MQIAILGFITVIGWFIYAYAIHSGWGWFITPEFGVAAPAPAVCLGIYMIIGLCTSYVPRVDVKMVLSETKKESLLTLVHGGINSIVMPLVVWLWMYLVYCYAY